MKKEAFRKLIRALRWPGKRKVVVTSLSSLKGQKNRLEEGLNTLNNLLRTGRISKEQYGEMSDKVVKQFTHLEHVESRLRQYKKLGDVDRSGIADKAQALLAGGGLVTVAGLGAKNIYDKEKEMSKYVSPLEELQLNKELPALQQELKDRKQYGSWF